jgi:hypothetical protein
LSGPPPDALDRLTSAAGREELARRALTALRLLAADGAPHRAGATGVSISAARAELGLVETRSLLGALEALVDHHLRAVLGDDAIVVRGEPAHDHAECWRRVGSYRGERPGLPDVPAPGEDAASVCARLVDALAGADSPPERVALWRARAARAVDGVRAAEDDLAALVAGPHERSLRAEALAERVGCLLDRGAVGRARDALEEQPELVASEPALTRLAGWTHLLAGEADAARDLLASSEPWAGPLPRPLARLRDERPGWLPMLDGRPEAARAGTCAAARPLEGREDVGASLLEVRAVGARGEGRVLHRETAPGRSACEDEGEAERRVLAEARGTREHRRRARAGGPLALAVEPVLDTEGEVCGWVRVECDHHRLPSEERLRATADHWAQRVRAAARGDARAEAVRWSDPDAADDPRRAAFEELVEELGLKTAQRRWWGFDLAPGGRPEPVARGGAWTEGSGEPGAGRALVRSLRSGGAVCWSEPSAELGVRVDAASGVVLPLGSNGATLGLLAIESRRRNDFRPRDVERWTRLLVERADLLRAARFSAWCRAHGRTPVHMDPRAASWEAVAPEVAVAARARGPVALVVPPGGGLSVLARWLAFEAGGGELELLPCAALGAEEVERRVLDGRGAERPAMRCLVGPGALPPALQLRLAGAEGAEAGRLLFGLRARPGEEPGLAPELAARLGRLPVALPPLRRRRDEVPALARLFAERAARAEGLPVPELAEGVLALLWRQPWPGNLRQLADLVERLVLHHPGSALGEAELRALARREGLELCRRIPSRHPDPVELALALRTTRRSGGALNRARAARYLGWDPDTLAARLRERGGAEAVAGGAATGNLFR